MTKQFKALVTALGGCVVLFTSFGQLLIGHDRWADLSTPETIGHVLLIIAAFITTLIGALYYDMGDKNV